MREITIEAKRPVRIEQGRLNYEQIEIVRELENAMDYFKIFNSFTRIAILSVVGKESGYELKSETSYRNTPNDNIRNVFGARLNQYSDGQLTELKQSDIDFFNAVYGGMYGNGLNEGYKYRGRGLNQLTFKANYEKVAQMIGESIVNNPDLLLVSNSVAAKACVAYFVNRFIGHNLEFSNQNEAILSVFRANAGWGKDISDPFHQKTLQKCKDYSRIFKY